MKILITAGATMTMIDQVRGITNVFRGKTGMMIANYLELSGADVTLLTSNPEHVNVVSKIVHYRTYDELYMNMQMLICNEKFDCIIHSSAVSDYRPDGVYVHVNNSVKEEEYDPRCHTLAPIDSSAKVGSNYEELYLKLVPTEKIVDKIRDPSGFKGKLVKFKLQVGMTDKELIDVATKSMHHSKADYIVANCLEWCRERAYIISAKDDSVIEVKRKALPYHLHELICN